MGALLVIALGVWACAAPSSTRESSGGDVQTTQVNKAGLKRAPELQGEVWLNGTPVSFLELRGQVVLVDFWTFG
jgi:hypothetical protein